MNMSYEELKEHADNLVSQRDKLVLELQESQEKIEHLERSKFKISQVIGINKGRREILQIINAFSSPSGVIVEVAGND